MAADQVRLQLLQELLGSAPPPLLDRLGSDKSEGTRVLPRQCRVQLSRAELASKVVRRWLVLFGSLLSYDGAVAIPTT